MIAYFVGGPSDGLIIDTKPPSPTDQYVYIYQTVPAEFSPTNRPRKESHRYCIIARSPEGYTAQYIGCMVLDH